jgi:short-subunit dehydrogenase
MFMRYALNFRVTLRKDIMNITNKLAVITGASKGMGAVFAQRLAMRGHDLLLVARSAPELETLAAGLRTATGRRIEVVAADLTDSADLQRLEDTLRARNDIAVLVNNAGVGSVTPLLDTKVDDMESMIALNVTALTRLTYAVVPQMAARGAGTVINVSSIVAIATEMMNGVYGASKSYVLAFTQSLQHELAQSGIRVQAVLPGVTATPFWDTLGHPLSKLPQEIIMSVEDLVDASLAGLDQGEVVTIPGLHDGEQWNAHEASRRALATQFGNAQPAARYR